MKRLRLRIDPHVNDPARWGHSLANLAEVMIPSLDAAGARSVVEIGAYAGDLTGLLLEWAAQRDARVIALDPLPNAKLVKLAAERDDLELIQETSLDALPTLELPDAIIIDGDHNYYTVSEELRIIGERAPGAQLPLLLFHDVGWPHARRDDYYTPEEVPEAFRNPTTPGGGLFPGEPGTRPGGLPYRHAASLEGGKGNGVLTAVEDFVAGQDGLRLVVVSAFFGFGAVWHEDVPWASDIAEVLDVWDRHPLLERLEANRVKHLADTHEQMMFTAAERDRNAYKDEVLQRLLQSKSFELAVRISKLRQKGEPAFTKDDVRHALAGVERQKE